MKSFAVIVPTLNASKDWPRFAPALLKCVDAKHVLLIDSTSSDNTIELAKAAGFRIEIIPRAEFNHGRTRQLAVNQLPDAEILIFMTQDAVLASPNAIELLVSSFEDLRVGAAFGRQLPRPGATPIEAHARSFNYPPTSGIRSLETCSTIGFKTIFLSNSFAAYRRDALMAVGGFPGDVLFGEDTLAAAKLVLGGWKIAYVSEAQVYHSHNYTLGEEFRRYFDVGVLHSREAWILARFGEVGGEGTRFVRSELKYIWPRVWLMPAALLRNVLKFVGYRLGRMESRLSLGWKRRLSMHSWYWRDQSGSGCGIK